MRGCLLFLILFFSSLPDCAVEASTTGAIMKHLKNFTPVLKWPRTSPKSVGTDGVAPQFENGYFVETLVDGDKLGIVPYTIRVSPEGELFAVDSENNNIVKITPPLSQYSRARLVAGSFQGYSGHVDGKPSDARFTHPKGVAMDEKGNVYVADTANLAIRKIGESGVTTIAGGKSNVAGYRDGPSEDAKFSADFDIVYVARTCSLLVIDRGNAALRQILLQQEDCDHQYNPISSSDIIMVAGAILAGYISCFLQHGFGSSLFYKKQSTMSNQQNHSSLNKPSLVVESLKEETDAGWPSPGRLISDLSKFAIEAISNSLLNLIFFPQSLLPRRKTPTPLEDNLIIPDDKPDPPLPPKQSNPSTKAETLTSSNINPDSSIRHQKSSKQSKHKDSSLPSKHRSTKRPDYTDFYTADTSQISSKIHKDRTRHRHREKDGEVGFGAETKGVESKQKEYNGEQSFDHYNMNHKYGADSSFRF
ncbi:uncharacterized protein LOC110018220 [Phalaenopsis equestris]|uniref:uncharacterized protein LOC110018220 n=1 Tax=Phalaenopsis equestris TaxID=78828 RepID=UPI0009E191BA|nr:uncharacterized protein LOC110018220 [Phalaenopsis equestris]